MRRARAVLVAAALAVLAARADAHPLAPSLLELRGRPDGSAVLVFRTPAVRAARAALTPVLPAGCRASGAPRITRDERAETVEIALDCGAEPLAGRAIGLDGLRESGTNALVRVELADGPRAQSVIDAARPRFTIPARAEWSETFLAYLRLGVVHIAGGLDHLLFVAGLVLLVPSRRALLVTVTAFTLGHALTLSCAALGLVRLPTAPIEVAIAASVFWLAILLAGARREAPPSARVAGGFGLLHGFGFAAALAEAGLPAADVPLALASFNAGIELGQLAVVAALLLVVRALRRFERPLAYVFGTLAGFWLIERTLAALGLA